MLDILAIVLGVALVVGALMDLINTLVTTSTATGRWWPSRMLGYRLFGVVRSIAGRMAEGSPFRERLLSSLGPLLILILLVAWMIQQILGFALIWWAVDGVSGVSGFGDSLYYSGVVYFTVGFGEVLPTGTWVRFGALAEAGCGVVSIALVVGYLPSLYSAYSEREKKLMTIDDGSDERITPTSLVMAWSPNADVDRLNARLAEWEEWVASIHETHVTLPMLVLFRSHDPRQNWVTALGLLADTALHAQMVVGCAGRTESYWLLRRIITLFDELTIGRDLSTYHDEHGYDPDGDPHEQFHELYRQMEAHGFELLPEDEAYRRTALLRNRTAPAMEYMIDFLVAPRGFWSPALGLNDLEVSLVEQRDSRLD